MVTGRTIQEVLLLILPHLTITIQVEALILLQIIIVVVVTLLRVEAAVVLLQEVAAHLQVVLEVVVEIPDVSEECMTVKFLKNKCKKIFL